MNVSPLRTIVNNKQYKVVQKNYKVYCVTCNRRAGRFDAYCGPLSYKKNRNWKQYRKTQYKEKLFH
jgi:hypothetical protein